MSRLDRRAYATMYGPTTGDRVQLGDTGLEIEVERDLGSYGDECKFGGGKVLRDGQGQMPGADDAHALDVVITNALIVDSGDMLARLTNDVIPSTTHRVVNPPGEKARQPSYSTPFFLHPNPDFLIDVLPSCVTPDNPSRYPEPITAQGYLEEGLREIKLK